MSLHPEPPLEDLTWTVAAARIILGPEMNIQAPPNLTPLSDSEEAGRGQEGLRRGWRELLDAGINDWG